MFQKRALLRLIVPLMLVALLAAACGTSSTAANGGSTPAPTTAPTAAATTPASTSSAVISTASATVKGKSVTILTNAKGLTLYYFKPDTATKSACTGGCAQTWPPLLFSGSGTPSSSTTLSGKLSVLNDANGAQVEYQGHPLYTFSGDSAAGQTNGEGIGGVWFVATTDLQSANNAAPAVTPTSSGGGYGY